MPIAVSKSTDVVIDLSKIEDGDLLVVGVWDRETNKHSRFIITPKVDDSGFERFTISPEYAPVSLVNQINELIAHLFEECGREVYYWARQHQKDRTAVPKKLYERVLKECTQGLRLYGAELQIGQPLQVFIPTVVSSTNISETLWGWSPLGLITSIEPVVEDWIPAIEAAKIKAELAL